MDIERSLKLKLKGTVKLQTPVRSHPLMATVFGDKIVFLPGKSKIPREVSWGAMVKVIEFLMEESWVEIGAAHNNDPKPGTLESHINEFGIKERGVVNYIAALLLHGRFVNINGELPSKIKLIKQAFS